MFRTKGFGWKLAAAATVIAALGIVSALRGESINPSLRRCLVQPARWDGTPVWFAQARVVASDLQGFEIDVQGVRVRVSPAAALAPQDTVAITGTFRAAGPRIELKEVRKIPEKARSRLLSEAVSIAVLLLVLLNFLRHFAFRPKAAQIQGVD
jgi:hypothetical protein